VKAGYIEAIVCRARRQADQHPGMELPRLEFPVHEILSDLLTQYYSAPANIPDEVIVPVEPETPMCARSCSQEARGKESESYRAAGGEKLRLLEMAMANARQSFASPPRQTKNPRKNARRICASSRPAQLAQAHGCYDNLETQGSMVVGSQVTFRRRRPVQESVPPLPDSQFRGSDDFASMYEVLSAGSTPVRETYTPLVGDRRRQGTLTSRSRCCASSGCSNQIDCVCAGQAARVNDVAKKK